MERFSGRKKKAEQSLNYMIRLHFESSNIRLCVIASVRMCNFSDSFWPRQLLILKFIITVKEKESVRGGGVERERQKERESTI